MIKYWKINDLATIYFIKEEFLTTEIKNHDCKILKDEDPFNALLQRKQWFNIELEFHQFIIDVQKFAKDYESLESKPENIQRLHKEIDVKIVELKAIPLFLEPQDKYLNLLTKSFLKNFSYETTTKFFKEAFNKEFWLFIIDYLLNKSNRKTFETYLNQTQEFINYWFHFQNYPFIITDKINIFPKKTREFIIDESIKIIDKEINLDNINSPRLQPVECLKLIKLIYDFSPANENFCEQKINSFLHSGHQYTDGSFYFLLDILWDLFKFTKLNKKINLEQQYHQRKNEYYKQVKWVELETDKRIDNELIWMKFRSLFFDELKAKSKESLFFALNNRNSSDIKVSNTITNLFQKYNKDTLFEYFQKKIHYDSKITLGERSILIFIDAIYDSLFIESDYSKKYSDSLFNMLQVFANKFKLNDAEYWKFYFLLNAIRDKLICKYDNSLIEQYNLIFITINFIEAILLILHNWKLEKENKPIIVLNDAIKIKDTIAKSNVQNQKLEFFENEFISFNSLNYLYFNFFAPTDMGGLDIRNKFIHGDFDILGLTPVYFKKLLILVLSVWEEINFNILLQSENKKEA